MNHEQDDNNECGCSYYVEFNVLQYPYLDKYSMSSQSHGLEQKRMMWAENMNHFYMRG